MPQLVSALGYRRAILSSEPVAFQRGNRAGHGPGGGLGGGPAWSGRRPRLARSQTAWAMRCSGRRAKPSTRTAPAGFQERECVHVVRILDGQRDGGCLGERADDQLQALVQRSLESGPERLLGCRCRPAALRHWPADWLREAAGSRSEGRGFRGRRPAAGPGRGRMVRLARNQWPGCRQAPGSIRGLKCAVANLVSCGRGFLCGCWSRPGVWVQANTLCSPPIPPTAPRIL